MRNGVIGSTADSDSVSRGSSPFSVAGNLPEASSLFYRSVAQLGRALRSGRRGRRFESCHSDFFIAIPQSLLIRLALRFFFFLSYCFRMNSGFFWGLSDFNRSGMSIKGCCNATNSLRKQSKN